MIRKWKIIDNPNPKDNSTTFRFMCDDEKNDLSLGEDFVDKYVRNFGYKTNGLIKIKMESDDVFYEIITTLPFSVFKKNNDFLDFVAISDKQVIGIKNNNNNYVKEKN